MTLETQQRDRRPPHLPRWTVRTRLAVLFPAVFLVCGAVLLAGIVLVWRSATAHVTINGRGEAVQLPGGATFIGLNRAAAAVQSSDSHQLVVVAAVAFAIMTVVSLALGWRLSGRFLRPLREITAATREISATTLHERLRLSGPEDELKQLADTFDQLLDRLERSFSFERRFVANASHELRTPLTTMRAQLDVAMAKPGAPVPEPLRALANRLRLELDHADRLLESFLALSQAQQAPMAGATTVSLSELARVALEPHTNVNVTQALEPGVWAAGSGTLLARMVGNVIDNAITHNEPGGWVRVSTEARDGQAHLVVENGGPRLDPAQVQRLTEPFRRIGGERTGSDKGAGLGLSIVASIVAVHGGTLELAARDEGGLRVTIALPLAPT